MPDPVVFMVARAGTPEAATADYVCDGIDDQVEINAAIAAAGAAGGGIVRLAAGDYSTSRPIEILVDGVAVEGQPGGGTSITPVPGFKSTGTAEGAGITGVVTFVGVDNFAARHLTIESGGVLINGLIAIPTGPDGAGEICTNGVFEGNTVRMEQGHTYSIWSLRSEGMQIIGNLVDGGATVDNAHISQEGIEIYGGRDVLISGNTIIGIGNAAIQLGGLAAQTPDCSIEQITVVDNHIYFSRVGVWIGTTWGPDGSQHARDILIENNVFESMFETGFQIRNSTGGADDPPEVSDVTFRNNSVEMLYSEAAGFNPAALLFFDRTGPGNSNRHRIVVEGNVFTTVAADAVPSPLYLTTTNSPFVTLLFFSDVTIRDNLFDLTVTSETSKGIIAYYGSDVVLAHNDFRGAGLFPIEFHEMERFSIEGNLLSDWGRGNKYSAIQISLASDYSITGNELRSAYGGEFELIRLVDSSEPLSLIDNLRLAEQDATLAGSAIQHLTLTGTAAIGVGNDLANTITGNALANILDGGVGDDRLIGGLGDDEYVVDSAGDLVMESAGAGFDRIRTGVSYILAPGSHVEVIEAADPADATPLTLKGNSFAQEIWGNAGANTLRGGGGSDVLIGLGGNDTYIIENVGVSVAEAANGGTRDIVYSAVDFTLGAGQHIEVLSALGHANTTALSLTGNSLAQEIWGNAGNNTLRGGGGNDTLVGQGGNDTYFVENLGVAVIENAVGGARDIVYSAVDFTLGTGQYIEVLSALDHASTTPLTLKGNSFAQEIWGNAGANTLRGGGGADVLIGLGGNDTYIIENVGVSVVEAVDGGTRDIVYSAVDYTLGAGQLIEVLSALGHANTTVLSLTGNSLAQEIWGNAGANTLDGGGGNDYLIGLGGNDTYLVDVAGVKVIESAGNGHDMVYSTVSYTLGANQSIEVLSARIHASTTSIKLTGNAFNNEIWGNAGANVVDGKGGNDVLVGLGGADTFAFTTALGAGNVDRITDFQTGLDKIALDDAIFTGIGATLDASEFVIGSAAADADDRIIYNSATGQLFFDADGAGGAAQVQFAILNAGPSLTAGDFVMIGAQGAAASKAGSAPQANEGNVPIAVTTVARAGTPEAATADFVCDGTDDQIEINAAIRQAGEGGGGTVSVAAGTYSTSGDINIGFDNIILQGAGVGLTVIEATPDTPKGAAIAFFGDNFQCRGFTVDVSQAQTNGIATLSASNGIIADCEVFTFPDWCYGIWIRDSESIQVLNNRVDGLTSHPAQEGIELSSSRSVIVSGNNVVNIGGAGIFIFNWADSSDIDIFNNEVDAGGGYRGIMLYHFNGGAATDIRIHDNVLRNSTEAGIYILASIDTTSGSVFDSINIYNNDIMTASAEDGAVSYVTGIYLSNVAAASAITFSNINVENNTIHNPTMTTQIGAIHASRFSHFSITGNNITSVDPPIYSQGISVDRGSDFSVTANQIDGAGNHGVFVVDSSRFLIEDNVIANWNASGTQVSGIMVRQSSGAEIFGNQLFGPTLPGTNPAILILPPDSTSAVANNTVVGTSADEILNGHDGGAGTLRGGGGDDTYLVDAFGDLVVEAAGEGRDVVYSTVDYRLPAGAEIEGLSARIHAATTPLTLTGNSFAQEIWGNAGANTLRGGGGADTLIGLGGNDIYIIENIGVRVIEGADGGARDSVYSAVDYTLGAGQYIEALSALSHASTAPLTLTGNSFAQEIWGNAGANTLRGGGGADVLIGLGGNDTYIIENVGVSVVEAVGGGTRDIVYSAVDFTLGAGQHIEVLSALGHANTTVLSLTGNSLAQEIWGNAGNNTLRGGGGNDTLVGQGGNDTYFVENLGVAVIENAVGGARDIVYSAVDFTLGTGQYIEVLSALGHASTTSIKLTGNAFNNEIWGNAGANVVDGKGGNDVLVGLGGADTFAFTTALGGGNIDVIGDFSAADDTIALDDAIFTALGLGALNANAFVIGSAALDADDRIIYNSGNGGLYYDADGSGAGAAVQFAWLTPGTALTASDFTVI